MAGQINKILTNLKAAIERVAQEEGNKNGKIDTMCEKNKIAELLAGAKQEVGDFIEKETDKINNKKLTQKEREKQLKNLSNQKDLFEDKTSSLNISIEDSLPLYKKMNKDGTISDIDNLKHTYKGGGFDTMLETFEDGSYSANVYDKKGNNIGMKLYKDDKHIITTKEAVAKKLGLSKDIKFENRYEDSLGEDEYVNFKNGRIYSWDDKKKMFVCTEKGIFIRNPGLFHNKYSICETSLENINRSRVGDSQIHNSLDYSIKTLDDGRLYANEKTDKAKAERAEFRKLLSELAELLRDNQNKTE